MGKKIAAMMAEHRERFVKGAIQNNIDEQKAVALFDLMEKFGGYGFNKSHSAAYALIAYQTAFLKAHFPVEFIAALLTSEMHSIDGVVKYIHECRTHDIEVDPPDVNSGDTIFTVSQGKIQFGLTAVKNVGEGAVEAIAQERQANGPYQSLFDFCERVDLRRVNKRVVESLIACGAFDSTGARRSQMMAVLEEALEYGQKVQKERCDPQMGLFDDGPDDCLSVTQPKLPALEEWAGKEAREKESLGFYISGHPLDPYRKMMDKFTNLDTAGLPEAPDGQTVRIGGIVAGSKIIRTKKEELMAFVQLEDMLGIVEVVVFPSVYAQCCDLLADDQPIVVQGKVQSEEKGAKILADTIVSMDQVESLWSAEIHFSLEMNGLDRKILERLRDIVKRHRGDCHGILHLKMADEAEAVIAMSEDWGIQPNGNLAREIKGLTVPVMMETVCAPIVEAPSNGSQKGNGAFRR